MNLMKGYTGKDRGFNRNSTVSADAKDLNQAQAISALDRVEQEIGKGRFVFILIEEIQLSGCLEHA